MGVDPAGLLLPAGRSVGRCRAVKELKYSGLKEGEGRAERGRGKR